MKAKAWLFALLLVSAASALSQQDQLAPARAELNEGVKAYKAANYEDAIQHFENVVRLDPAMKVGRMYLATAYAQQYVPGVETPENVANATKALEQYDQILQMDPKNQLSTKERAYLKMQLKRFDEAKEDYKRAAELDPNDPEPYYSIGVMDWTMAYRSIMEAKSNLNSQEDDAIVLSSSCPGLRTEQLANVEAGILMLTRAIDLRKDYDDAMVYLNLLFRLRANLQCGDKAARRADIKKSEEWTDEAMAVRKKKAERPNGTMVDNPK